MPALGGDGDIRTAVPHLRCLLAVPSPRQDVVAGGERVRHLEGIDHLELESAAVCRDAIAIPARERERGLKKANEEKYTTHQV